MAAHLSWLDHDASQRDRMTRILALFREKDTRDELGLGGIRDAIADRLFPGTSTIQTRLRYMLFVPWIYGDLEGERVSSEKIAQRARGAEIKLVEPLLSDPKERGVLGRLAGRDLKRLPSSVYWNGLGSWGIRRFEGSVDDYHRLFDLLHRRRASARKRDDGDEDIVPTATWDPTLPKAPRDFPKGASFALTKDEAEYLRDRIVVSHPQSFLAWLVQRPPHEPPDWPWAWLGMRAGLEPDHRALLLHGRLLSEVGYEASLVYNLALAEHHGRNERAKELQDELERWVKDKDKERAPIDDWNVNALWPLVLGQGHTITKGARTFVNQWVEYSRTRSMDVIASQPAKELVKRRERFLKGSRSRFRRSSEDWSGSSGLFRANYRWGTVSTFLEDLFDGLGA